MLLYNFIVIIILKYFASLNFFSHCHCILYVGSFQALKNSLYFIVSHFIFSSEDSFPRLGSMIVDYENPLKKIAEQFVPHQQVRLFVCT